MGSIAFDGSGHLTILTSVDPAIILLFIISLNKNNQELEQKTVFADYLLSPRFFIYGADGK